MWNGTQKRLLREVLDMLDLPEFASWTVHDLCGSGRGFRSLNHMEVEALTQRKEGLELDFSGLIELAGSLSDLQDVLVLARSKGLVIASLEAIDSSIWKIELRET